ncbi:MAG: hypothetical protein HOO67_05595 [Candidatus Peribacteraceae bacterium]|nr:hypothetical protein [Candidatus Peribacteraceae bacterium]
MGQGLGCKQLTVQPCARCEGLCGNHALDFGEECDDGDTGDGDGCDHACKLEGTFCAASSSSAGTSATSSSSAIATTGACNVCPGEPPQSWTWTVPAGTFPDVLLPSAGGGSNFSVLNGRTVTFQLDDRMIGGACRWGNNEYFYGTPGLRIVMDVRIGNYTSSDRGPFGAMTLHMDGLANWTYIFPQAIDCSQSVTVPHNAGGTPPISVPQTIILTPVP